MNQRVHEVKTGVGERPCMYPFASNMTSVSARSQTMNQCVHRGENGGRRASIYMTSCHQTDAGVDQLEAAIHLARTLPGSFFASMRSSLRPTRTGR